MSNSSWNSFDDKFIKSTFWEVWLIPVGNTDVGAVAAAATAAAVVGDIDPANDNDDEVDKGCENVDRGGIHLDTSELGRHIPAIAAATAAAVIIAANEDVDPVDTVAG